MRRIAKSKILASRVTVRKAATTAAAASRRPYPAWIVADESGIAFPAVAVTPRVRTSLVLRMVGKVKSIKPKRSPDGHGAR